MMNQLPGGTLKTKQHSLRYNDGKVKWSMVDMTALEPMVRVLMYGAHKYSTFQNIETKEIVKGKDMPADFDRSKFTVLTSGTDNWKIAFEVKDLYDSLQRHMVLLQAGEENDIESKLHHIGHILCNAMFISHYINRGQKY